jgi:L-serine dehydratase
MEFISILNDVLGPVMHGPSSSHTAGSYHIGRIALSLLGDEPERVSFVFDPAGSYAQTYRQQGVDLAFAAGIMGWPIADERFSRALETAAARGLDLSFEIAPLFQPDHPNTVLIKMASKSRRSLTLTAKSTGGGGVVVSELDGRPVFLTGKSHDVIVLAVKHEAHHLKQAVGSLAGITAPPTEIILLDETLLTFRSPNPLAPEAKNRIAVLPGVKAIWTAEPVFFVQKGEALFLNAAEMVRLAEDRSVSLGRVALAYEAQILGLPETDVLAEMSRRFEIMREACRRGLDNRDIRMQLLHPTAHKVFQAESEGKTAIGGIHTRAAARALAVMHVSNSQGIVVAAPTGGASGVIPGVVVTLAEEMKLNNERAALALFAASAVGLILAIRATFAAEVAGCQVEIGAAGAMAAAAVVEVAGGTARQAADAAAISFQNTMGSVCDLVQGMCEIPCHTRNAVAASGAFVCADLILGGYENPVPLDETIDAVYDSGKMLPPELRCTAMGGLALAPSAKSLPLLRINTPADSRSSGCPEKFTPKK